VIFNSDGFELVLVFWGNAARSSSGQKDAARALAAPVMKERLFIAGVKPGFTGWSPCRHNSLVGLAAGDQHITTGAS
jgi:hypothetical protein